MKKFLPFLFISFLIAAQNARGQDNFDVRVVKNLQAHRTGGKTSLFTTMSGTATPVSAGIPLLLFLKGSIEKDKVQKKQALYMLEGVAISQASTFMLKAIINRQRPAENDPAIIALKNAKNGSFPSGHTAAAFATATSLTLINHKWYVVVPAYTWASLVGYSRLYLGVHYPTDVFAGALLGSGSAWITYKLNKWMHHNKKRKA